MKILLIFSALILASCLSSHNIVTPKPTPQMAAVSGKSYPALRQGHKIYHLHCAHCHEHRLPNTASVPAWHLKISTMATRAQLTKEDEKMLQLYLDEFTDR